MGKGTVLVMGSIEPNVTQDRELMTGQNPRSDQGLAEMLVKALDRQSVPASAHSP